MPVWIMANVGMNILNIVYSVFVNNVEMNDDSYELYVGS
jgi:hypothetical protein